MRFSLLRKSVAWWVFFTITAMISIPMMFLPIPWLGLLAVFPAYWVAIKIALLPPKHRKAQHSFWMPATINLIVIWVITNIFGPALYRLFAPVFMLFPEEFYYVWPTICAIPASYICFLLTVPDVAAWTAESAADGETTPAADMPDSPSTKSFLNKYTANDENAN